MKKIRVAFVGFWQGFDVYNFFVYKILSSMYEVVLDECEPDYIFCSLFGSPYEALKYDGVRIFLSGENYSPDFNHMDYAIGFDRLEYGDRYFRYPQYLWECLDAAEIAHVRSKDQQLHDFKEKSEFCNLIYSHERDDMGRKIIMDELSKYKKVDAAGYLYNNMDNGMRVNRAEKQDFQRKYKFTIAFESVCTSGFITEKIFDAFVANSIPIYFGAEDIGNEFNEKAMIKCKSLDDLEGVVEEIIELDRDDKLYLEKLRQPIFNRENYMNEEEEKLKIFLKNIFEQDKECAYRRQLGPKVGIIKNEEKNLLILNKLYKNKWFLFGKRVVRKVLSMKQE